MNTASTWGTAQEGWRKKLDRVGQGGASPLFHGRSMICRESLTRYAAAQHKPLKM